MTSIGPYPVVGELARGGSSVVYRCADPSRPDEEVALKRVERFDPRLRLVRHTNVVSVVDDFADGPAHVVVMEIVDGPTLASVVGSGRRFSATEVRDLLAALARGIGHLHRSCLVHGDVSPANVVLAGRGPVLVDVAANGPRSGTPGFVDATVAAGAATDEHGDLYGLGALGFYAATGRPPASGERLGDVLPGFDVGVAEMVDRAVAPRRLDRFATAAEMEAHLELVGAPHDEGPVAGPVLCPTRTFGPGPPRSAEQQAVEIRSWAIDRRTVAMGAAAAAVVLIALLVATVPGRLGGRADAAPATTCPPPSPVPSVPGQTILWADVRGSGCPSPVAWAAGVVEVALDDGRPATRFRLGQPRDQLVLGDWFCRHRDAPALYRPSTGEVWYFGSWARPGGPLASEVTEHTGIRNGTARASTTAKAAHHAKTPRCACVDLRGGTSFPETP